MRKFPIGVMTDSFRLPFHEALQEAKKLGADGIQLYAVPAKEQKGGLIPENLSHDDRKELKQLLDDTGLLASALCGDLGGHGFAVQSENPERLERSKRIVDLALELGSAVVTTHIGVVPADSTCERYKIMQEACNVLAEYAFSQGVRFAVETGPEPAAVLKRFLDSLSSSGVAVNYDPANFVMVTGQDPVEGVHILKDYIVHTHAKDGIMLRQTEPKIIYDFFAEGGIGDLRLEEYFREMPLGQGQVDFPAYLNALEEIGYQGFLTIERETGKNPAADIGAAAEYLRELMR